MAGHQYWRLYVIQPVGSAVVGLTEIEFRATPGGADQTGAGTPLASSEFSGAFLKANAYDNGAAEWASQTVMPQWIGYNFGVAVAVQQVYVSSRTSDTSAVNASQAPKDFDVQYSDDGVTWTTAWQERGRSSWAGTGDSQLFTNAQALESTKAVTYVPIGPPLLLSCTKAVMYVVTGPPRQQFKVRLLKSIPLGLNT